MKQPTQKELKELLKGSKIDRQKLMEAEKHTGEKFSVLIRKCEIIIWALEHHIDER